MREAQRGVTVDLRELGGETVQFEPGMLGNRGESPKDLRWKYAEVVIE